MNNIFDRFILQIGEENFIKINNSNVIVFGIGGVGGNAVEALVRSGIGSITIVDSDIIDVTNINRQIISSTENIGKLKVDACEERMIKINPDLKITKIPRKFGYGEIIDFSKFDYVIDAVDDINAKIEIIKESKKNNIPVISSMGMGNKTDPTMLKVDDISLTSVCPLAKIIREKLRKLNIQNVRCVYSTEKVIKTKTNTISSNAFVPSCAGIIMAREVVFDIINK